MGVPDPATMSFEIECHKLLDLTEFCRFFFRSASGIPEGIEFGLDPEKTAPFEEFKEQNAGKIVARFQKLVVYIKHVKTGAHNRLVIDLDPIWPTVESPSDIRMRLSSLDITGAVESLLKK
jgi:hypothetical protein